MHGHRQHAQKLTFSRVVREIRVRTDRQTDTYMLITILRCTTGDRQ